MIPHFALPFRFGGGHVVVVDQDTKDDVLACVEAAFRTIVGQRDELPDFGVPDLVFQQQPVPVSDVINSVLAHEDRLTLLMEQHPDFYDRFVARIQALVSIREAGNA